MIMWIVLIKIHPLIRFLKLVINMKKKAFLCICFFHCFCVILHLQKNKTKVPHYFVFLNMSHVY